MEGCFSQGLETIVGPTCMRQIQCLLGGWGLSAEFLVVYSLLLDLVGRNICSCNVACWQKFVRMKLLRNVLSAVNLVNILTLTASHTGTFLGNLQEK